MATDNRQVLDTLKLRDTETGLVEEYALQDAELRQQVGVQTNALNAKIDDTKQELHEADLGLANIHDSHFGELRTALNVLKAQLASSSATNDARITQAVLDLTARIDNIVANANATEGNSEMVDIRTGANGRVYTSAGKAVREQLTDINDYIGTDTLGLLNIDRNNILPSGEGTLDGVVDKQGERLKAVEYLLYSIIGFTTTGELKNRTISGIQRDIRLLQNLLNTTDYLLGYSEYADYVNIDGRGTILTDPENPASVVDLLGKAISRIDTLEYLLYTILGFNTDGSVRNPYIRQIKSVADKTHEFVSTWSFADGMNIDRNNILREHNPNGTLEERVISHRERLEKLEWLMHSILNVTDDGVVKDGLRRYIDVQDNKTQTQVADITSKMGEIPTADGMNIDRNNILREHNPNGTLEERVISHRERLEKLEWLMHSILNVTDDGVVKDGLRRYIDVQDNKTQTQVADITSKMGEIPTADGMNIDRNNILREISEKSVEESIYLIKNRLKDLEYTLYDVLGYKTSEKGRNELLTADALTGKVWDKIEKQTKSIIDSQTKNETKKSVEEEVIMYNGDQGRAYIGNAAYQKPGQTHYCVFMMYGQSLSNGSENPAGFDDPAQPNCYMLGSNVWDVKGTKLNPLKVGGTVRADGVATGTRQDIIVSAVNVFANLYRQNCPWDKDTKFIACSAGVGGRTVAQLSSASRYPTCNEHQLDARFRPALQHMKAIADAEGATISCAGIFWVQGESDYGSSYIGYKESDVPRTEGTNQSCGGSKDAYKKRLTQLKEDLQATCKEVFGADQENNPLFFPYSVCGHYINNNFMTINDATAEMADEQDDVIQVGPTYVTPDYQGGHLAMNGYRWYGEYCAKTMYQVFMKGIDFRPLQPYNYEVSGDKIYIYFNPMVAPLRFDKYTNLAYKNNGFRVRCGTVAELDSDKTGTGKDVQINDIKIVDNCVVLTCAKVLTGAVEITYAGSQRNGAGNLRDSDTWNALYTYRADGADHGSKNTNWSVVGQATEEQMETLEYWDGTFAASTGYSQNDLVLYDVMEYSVPAVLKSGVNNNKSTPYNTLNYRPVDVKGNSIVGKRYPMQNWCLNFYKRIILA